MKLLKIIGHPVTVMVMFLFIIIIGEHLGGFYLLYILLGLPYGAPHSIIALAGLLTMLLGCKLDRRRQAFLKPPLYFIGVSAKTVALITFFKESEGYNDNTFSQTVPVISICLFAFFSICCLVLSVCTAVKGKGKNLGLASDSAIAATKIYKPNA